MQHSEPEKILFEATVCFLVRDNKVLLARKTRGIGAGCLNGYGGGPEDVDTCIEDTNAREMHEESDGTIINQDATHKVGIINFHNQKESGGEFCCTVHFFVCTDWINDPKETEEMSEPTWFSINDLPVYEMMPGDAAAVPPMLAGKKIRADVYYTARQKALARPVEFEEVDEL